MQRRAKAWNAFFVEKWLNRKVVLNNQLGRDKKGTMYV